MMMQTFPVEVTTITQSSGHCRDDEEDSGNKVSTHGRGRGRGRGRRFLFPMRAVTMRRSFFVLIL